VSGTVEELLAVTKAEVGYREHGRNRTKYGEWFGFNGVAWCSIWVAWCLARIGMDPRPFIDNYASVELAFSGWKRLGRYVGKMDIIPGDILWFKFPTGNHTGFAISKPYRRGLIWYVRTREGNTAVGNDRSGGGVDEKERKLSIVVAVARPAYRVPGSAPAQPPASTTPDPTGSVFLPVERRGLFKGQTTDTANIFAFQMELAAVSPIFDAHSEAAFQAERNAIQFGDQTAWRAHAFVQILQLNGNREFDTLPSSVVSPQLFKALDFVFWLHSGKTQQPVPAN
jgi:hypothetical protein